MENPLYLKFLRKKLNKNRVKTYNYRGICPLINDNSRRNSKKLPQKELGDIN